MVHRLNFGKEPTAAALLYKQASKGTRYVKSDETEAVIALYYASNSDGCLLFDWPNGDRERWNFDGLGTFLLNP